MYGMQSKNKKSHSEFKKELVDKLSDSEGDLDLTNIMEWHIVREVIFAEEKVYNCNAIEYKFE